MSVKNDGGWRFPLKLAGISVICWALIIWLFVHSHGTYHRAMISMFMVESREVDNQLQDFRSKHGMYPPLGANKSVYTYLSDRLTTPSTLVSEDFRTSSPIYRGPLVDPYRHTLMFAGERLEKAWFHDGRNSEGFYSYWKGYPPRYYRNVTGDFAVILSNGPDLDSDLTEVELDRMTSDSEKFSKFFSLYQNHIYDATNGDISSGDLFRIVVPD